MFEARPSKHVTLSISAGVAVFPHDGNSDEALLATADNRMYHNKRTRKRDAHRQLSAAGPGDLTN